jgi:hypothetical protein
MLRQCSGCRVMKPLSEFYRNKNKKYGRGYKCKTCFMEKRRQECIENPERYINASRRFRENHPGVCAEYARQRRKNNIDKVRESNRKYRLSHREAHANAARLWREANPERATENRKKYAEKHPEMNVACLQRRRARKLKAGGNFTAQEWRDLKAFYNHTCLCCGKQEPEIKLSPDHVKALADGGSNSIDNIQPLCKLCNERKYTKHIDYRPLTHRWEAVAEMTR